MPTTFKFISKIHTSLSQKLQSCIIFCYSTSPFRCLIDVVNSVGPKLNSWSFSPRFSPLIAFSSQCIAPFCLKLLKSEFLKLSLTSLVLSHTTLNPSQNLVGFTLKYIQVQSLSTAIILMWATITYCLDYYSSLINGFYFYNGSHPLQFVFTTAALGIPVKASVNTAFL